MSKIVRNVVRYLGIYALLLFVACSLIFGLSAINDIFIKPLLGE